uniref:PPFIA binding protein 2 n=1 Tax=Nothobranchius furzeri TaxID=105023 RepID=A0A8C6VVI5_NOTFU
MVSMLKIKIHLFVPGVTPDSCILHLIPSFPRVFVQVSLCSPASNETYQERLLRLEGDKESLVLQVSVLTDQVEAQGEKIRDLESSLEEHRQKLASTEEMLQQELRSRTSLETQKLDLMDEVSYLKLRLVSVEEMHTNTLPQVPADIKNNKAESVVNLISELQEQMCKFQEEISTRIQEKRALEGKEGGPGGHPTQDCSPPVGPVCSDLSLSGSDSRSCKGGQTSTSIWIFNGKSCCSDSFSVSLPLTDNLEKPDECILSDQSPLSSGVDSGQQSPVSPEKRKGQRGIRKLWGRIRRSQSGSPVQAHDPELGDFRRGGYRATAGPRLARSGKTRDLKLPFSKWSTEQVCDWLEDIGLGQYGFLARHWVSSGQTMLSATQHDIEKEMSMKNPLHRKKLQLAMKTATSKQPEKSAELDYVWVTRWLDDIGLPQYKDQFNDGRVDGHVLKYLTVNDLLFLKVTSQLHHLSIKCAIRVLHVNQFNPNCLKRRPSNENQFSPSEVMQWSNHRVMEWLRSVDLAEYAPNLRGSGVHGGLIMLEPRFNSDTLAMLLNISPQKTLLRRHLNTNFSNLVGAQAQQEKREYTEAAGYAPLSVTAKVKPKKLGFSSLTHLRRRRPDDSTDYVCPIGSSPESGLQAPNGVQMRPFAGFRGLSPILDREPARDQMANSERAVSEIEALSESINNLTVSSDTHKLLGNDSHSSPLLVRSNGSLSCRLKILLMSRKAQN